VSLAPAVEEKRIQWLGAQRSEKVMSRAGPERVRRKERVKRKNEPSSDPAFHGPWPKKKNPNPVEGGEGSQKGTYAYVYRNQIRREPSLCS